MNYDALNMDVAAKKAKNSFMESQRWMMAREVFFFSFAQHCDVTVKPTFNLKNHHLITVSLLAYELLNYGLNHICEVTEIWNVDKQVLIASSLSPGIICAWGDEMISRCFSWEIMLMRIGQTT